MCERMIHHWIILQCVPLGQARTLGSLPCASNNSSLLMRSVWFLENKEHYLFAQVPHQGSTALYIIKLTTTLRWYGVTGLAVASVPSWITQFQYHGSWCGICEEQNTTGAGLSPSTAIPFLVTISSIYHIHLSSHANTTNPFQATELASPIRNDYAVPYRQQCWASPCTPVDNWIAVWMGLAVQKKSCLCWESRHSQLDIKFLLTLLPSSLWLPPIIDWQQVVYEMQLAENMFTFFYTSSTVCVRYVMLKERIVMSANVSECAIKWLWAVSRYKFSLEEFKWEPQWW